MLDALVGGDFDTRSPQPILPVVLLLSLKSVSSYQFLESATSSSSEPVIVFWRTPRTRVPAYDFDTNLIAAQANLENLRRWSPPTFLVICCQSNVRPLSVSWCKWLGFEQCTLFVTNRPPMVCRVLKPVSMSGACLLFCTLQFVSVTSGAKLYEPEIRVQTNNAVLSG